MTAQQQLAAWTHGLQHPSAEPQQALQVVAQLRAALANDLDTPLMLSIITRAAQTGVDNPRYLAQAVENLLGVKIFADQGEEEQ